MPRHFILNGSQCDEIFHDVSQKIGWPTWRVKECFNTVLGTGVSKLKSGEQHTVALGKYIQLGVQSKESNRRYPVRLRKVTEALNFKGIWVKQQTSMPPAVSDALDQV